MSSCCPRAMGEGRWELERLPIADFLRVAALTLVAFGVSWQLASHAATGDDSFDAAARVRTAARGLAVAARYGAGASSFRTTASGSFLSLATGLRVAVVDGGSAAGLRVPRGSTVLDALDRAGVTVGPLDRVEAREDGSVAAGDVIKVVRVGESQTVVREPVGFPIQTVSDASLPAGRVVVATPGSPGVADNTYLVRTDDGVVAARVLLASVQIVAPVPEVRRVGTFRQTPPAGGDIEAIIRAAAAEWGADPSQLLRVAYCESHYNPSAFNASSGASGLFQFLTTTWAANSARAGYAGASVFDPV